MSKSDSQGQNVDPTADEDSTRAIVTKAATPHSESLQWDDKAWMAAAETIHASVKRQAEVA